MTTGKRFLIDISLDFILDEFEIWPEELDEGFQVNAKAVLKELTSGYSILDKLRDLGIEIKPEHVTVGELGDPSSTVYGD